MILTSYQRVFELHLKVQFCLQQVKRLLLQLDPAVIHSRPDLLLESSDEQE